MNATVYSSTSAARKMALAFTCLPAPSASNAAITCGSRLIPMVRLCSPSAFGGRPRFDRLGWLVMSGDHKFLAELGKVAALILGKKPNRVGRPHVVMDILSDFIIHEGISVFEIARGERVIVNVSIRPAAGHGGVEGTFRRAPITTLGKRSLSGLEATSFVSVIGMPMTSPFNRELRHRPSPPLSRRGARSLIGDALSLQQKFRAHNRISAVVKNNGQRAADVGLFEPVGYGPSGGLGLVLVVLIILVLLGRV